MIGMQRRQTVGPADAGEGGWDQSLGSHDQALDVSSKSNENTLSKRITESGLYF